MSRRRTKTPQEAFNDALVAHNCAVAGVKPRPAGEPWEQLRARWHRGRQRQSAVAASIRAEFDALRRDGIGADSPIYHERLDRARHEASRAFDTATPPLP